jgi:hypothetical protein
VTSPDASPPDGGLPDAPPPDAAAPDAGLDAGANAGVVGVIHVLDDSVEAESRAGTQIGSWNARAVPGRTRTRRARG